MHRSLHERIDGMIRAAYRKTHVSRDLAALYGSRTLMRISLGIIGVFVPIYFFQKFNHDVQVVIAIYLALFGLNLLLLPIGARLLNIVGMRRMIMTGVVLALAAVAALYVFPGEPAAAAIFYLCFNAAYRAVYWVPYHVNFAESLDAAHRGRQLAILRNIASVILVVVPFIGGVLISLGGFDIAFAVSIVLMAISLVPLWFMHDSYERYSWNYVESFMHLFARRNRPLFLAHASNGAQGMAILVFWPVFAFTLLDERYTILGLVTSLTIVIVVALQWFAGDLFDKWDEKRVLMVGVVMATTGWVSKLFVQTPVQILAADSYHQFGRTVNTLTFDAATYEQSAENGRYVDEYTTLKEMALCVGRIVMLLLMAVLIAYVDLRVAFVLAALFALLMLLLNHAAKVE